MSNFSRTYQCYLQGYIGDVIQVTAHNISERQMQALALGVHHRTTGKAPLLRSVEVMAMLRPPRPRQVGVADLDIKSAPVVPATTAPTLRGDVVLVAVGPSKKIHAIKVVREICDLSLMEAKDLVDQVTGPPTFSDGQHIGYCGGVPTTLLCGRPDLAESLAKALRAIDCTVEVK